MDEQTQKGDKERKKVFDFAFLKKLKSIKHFQLILCGVLSAIILLIFFSSYTKSNSSTKKIQELSNDTINKNASSIFEYSSMLEKKLTSVLSGVKGCKNVSVMIVVESSPKITLAEHLEKEHSVSGESESQLITQYPISIDSGSSDDFYAIVETAPKVTGVLVVATGASNTKVKLAIISAIQALLSVDANSIEVLEGD